MATVSEFRSAFPEFADALKYSDALITYWLAVASRVVSPDRWGTMKDTGIYLALAHYVLLASRNAQKPGDAGVGVVTSKSVDTVSVGLDASSGAVDGWGLWNATSYGRQYANLANIYGAGGLQL